MMVLSSGIRGGAGRLSRAVAHVVPAALAVTAMVAAIWAGPVAYASADTQPRAASPSPARVKFYVVPPPENGHADSLFIIAAETLGDGGRFMEIFSLNKGRLQPNGGRLTNPRIIEPGWILQLPADAAGPGVHFGPLPVVTPPTSHQPYRPGGTGSAIMISEALLAFVVAGLAVRLIRRRAGPGLRRRPIRARTPEPRATGSAACSPTPASPQQAPGRSGSPAALRYAPAVLIPEIQRRAARPTGTPGPSPQTHLDVSRSSGRDRILALRLGRDEEPRWPREAGAAGEPDSAGR